MLKNFLFIFRFNPAAVRKAVLLEILHGLLIAAPTGILFFVLKELFSGQPDTGLIRNAIYLMCGLMIVQFWIASKAAVASNSMVYDLSNKLRIKLGNHLQKLSLGHYKQRDPGDIASVILQDVANFEMIFAHSINNIASAVIGTSLIFGFLLVSDWQLALILISALFIALPLMVFANYLIHKLGKKQIAARNATGARFLEYIQGIRYIKAFGRTGSRFRSLDVALDTLRRESIRMEALPGPMVVVSSVFFEIFYLLMIWVALHEYQGQFLTLPVMIGFLIIGYRLYEPLKILLVDYVIMRYMNISLDRVLTVLRTPVPEVVREQIPSRFDIEFEDVSFAYAEKPVLSNISWAAGANSMTALVGASGSGKTTITSLIARFWDVTGGSVRIGGVDIRSIPQDALYSYISEVFQDVYLFDDTIYNNIKIGKPDATEHEILDAAGKAEVLEFTFEMKEGIHTRVGEGGSRLSGGQKQRVSIARALLKNAPIVLLDEATASLDPENEIYIQEAIQELVRNKTVIVIAHKLATVRNADQILVLKDGHIHERGNHKSLLALQGEYRKLWDIQQKASGWKVGKVGVG